ncbi:RluA family pseudouridine synthase [Undibacterium cyanobacteriorum]|uniref:RluA family pseudouridine synthase n=1 Tax=Undibacterium cyanobacteriorum TaxID=3073561 RepID=A0ABY9RNQ1_9BURK|nr:RluA family pseudouridine synthase [Undibacterium sp. 20NA77.5]WMW81626.1 RluA family pseudouridine synthase [Undibacterium sp. 20NA77.5]
MSKISSPLPMRDGVSPSFVWVPEGKWTTVLNFLCQHFPDISEETWRARFTKQEVCDQTGQRLTAESSIERGMCLFYYREVAHETPIPFEEVILHQDEHLLVVDKPHFLPVTPGGQYLQETLLVRLKNRTGIEELTPLHRLDRETAGVILFSVNRTSRGAYQSLFQQQQIRKIYQAIAPKIENLSFPYLKRSRLVESSRFFVMEEVPGEANAETLIEVLEDRGEYALYRLSPKSGKKHQLRVHMANLGAPLVNDLFYPEIKPSGSDDYTKPLKLLAHSIAFRDPITEQERRFQSNLSL